MRLRMSRGMAAMIIFSLVGIAFSVFFGVYGLEDVSASVRVLLPVGAAVVLHEMGHIVAARPCGVRMRDLRVDLFGARLRLLGILSYRREWIIAASGPLVNLLSAALLWFFLYGMDARAAAEHMTLGDMDGTFLLSSLCLAAVNLLPVRSMDGGRMLYCTLAPLLGERVAHAVLTLGTAICLGTLWAFSVYALLRVGEMLSLFAFSICLLLRMTER